MAQEPTLQLAQVLSDLVSLGSGLCDPEAAINLVSASISNPTPPPAAPPNGPTAATKAQHDEQGEDPDLVRARELLRLHRQIRIPCERGEVARVLDEVRASVGRALSGY